MMIDLFKAVFFSLWLQRLMGWGAIVAVMYQIHDGGAPSWYVWLLLIMFVLIEYLAFYRGIEHGIRTFVNMSHRDQIKVKKLLEPEDENTEH